MKPSPEISDLCERTNLTPSQVKAALRELEDKGFLARTTPEERAWSERRWSDPILRDYRLTMFPCNGKRATRDYLKWTPPESAEVGARRNGK
jgi:hypothetical protein